MIWRFINSVVVVFVFGGVFFLGGGVVVFLDLFCYIEKLTVHVTGDTAVSYRL